MKPRIDLTFSELYALERAAQSARAQETARLIRAGVDAFVRVLVQFASHAVSVPHERNRVSHA